MLASHLWSLPSHIQKIETPVLVARDCEMRPAGFAFRMKYLAALAMTVFRAVYSATGAVPELVAKMPWYGLEFTKINLKRMREVQIGRNDCERPPSIREKARTILHQRLKDSCPTPFFSSSYLRPRPFLRTSSWSRGIDAPPPPISLGQHVSDWSPQPPAVKKMVAFTVVGLIISMVDNFLI